MKKWDEPTALAVCFSNTRTKKRRDDLATVSSAMAYLVSLYGSQKSVAEKLDLSTEMIRQFLTVLRLPASVIELFSTRQIDSVDMAKELAALSDPKEQELAAFAIANVPSKDVRDIKRLIRMGHHGTQEAAKAVLDARPRGMNIFLLDFDNAVLKKLRREAKARDIEVADLIRDVVTDWCKVISKPGGGKGE